jgi:hypothetical protein
MVNQLLSEKYDEALYGVLNCYDRIIISGNLHPLCYAQGMTRYLYTHEIRIFDYATEFADPLRHAVRDNAEAIAKESGLEIGHRFKVAKWQLYTFGAECMLT